MSRSIADYIGRGVVAFALLVLFGMGVATCSSSAIFNWDRSFFKESEWNCTPEVRGLLPSTEHVRSAEVLLPSGGLVEFLDIPTSDPDPRGLTPTAWAFIRVTRADGAQFSLPISSVEAGGT